MSTTTTYPSHLPLGSIVIGKNIRTVVRDEAFTQLCQSVQMSGVIQSLLVRPNIDGKFELVAGFRRHAAAVDSKCADVPVSVRCLTDQQALELQLVENVQRVDLHPLDEAAALERLRVEFKLPVDPDLCRKVNKSRTHVYDSLSLLKLSDKAQAAFRKGDIDRSVAVVLARIAPDLQNAALSDSKNHHATYRDQLKWVEEKSKDEAAKREKWRKAVEAAEAKGIVVLPIAEGKCIVGYGYQCQSKGYYDLSDTCHFDKRKRSYAKLLTGAKITRYLAQNRYGLPVYLAKMADVDAVLAKLGIVKPQQKEGNTSSSTPHAPTKAEIEKRKLDEAITEETNNRLQKAALDAVNDKSALEVLGLILEHAYVDAQRPKKLTLSTVAHEFLRSTFDNYLPEELLTGLIRSLKLDEKGIEKAVRAEMTKPVTLKKETKKKGGKR